MSCGFHVWVAHASRVLVWASRRNNLSFGFDPQKATKADEESSRSRGCNRQHARRVRYPIKFAAR
jgi:hypothetical protein